MYFYNNYIMIEPPLFSHRTKILGVLGGKPFLRCTAQQGLDLIIEIPVIRFVKERP